MNGTVINALTSEAIYGAKVTVELPGDDLISYSFFNGYFPSSNYDYHSFMLNPGSYTITVTKTDYYLYTTTVNIVAGQVLTLNVQLQPEWVSPNTYSDPSNGWFFETKAYDDSLDTRAESEALGILDPWQWSDYLTLTLTNSVMCDKVRFYAFYHADYVNKIHIDVYYGGTWHPLYEGAFSNKAWVEKTLSGTYSVIKVRVKFYYKGCLGGTTADLYELDFHKI